MFLCQNVDLAQVSGIILRVSKTDSVSFTACGTQQGL